MKLLTGLFFKAYKHDLGFQYFSATKSIYVKSLGLETISYGRLNHRHETPEETLKRMHQEVDDYLTPDVEEYDEYYVEEARAMLTEQEQAMREVGMKESDFR